MGPAGRHVKLGGSAGRPDAGGVGDGSSGKVSAAPTSMKVQVGGPYRCGVRRDVRAAAGVAERRPTGLVAGAVTGADAAICRAETVSLRSSSSGHSSI